MFEAQSYTLGPNSQFQTEGEILSTLLYKQSELLKLTFQSQRKVTSLCNQNVPSRKPSKARALESRTAFTVKGQ